MLLAPEQAYFVRENLRLRLLDARIALMQHNGEVFLSDLNNAEATVKQYFDNQSPATQAWLKELAELKSVDMRTVSNESLKASLAAVRNYQDTVRGTQSIQLPDLKSVAPAEVPASAPAEKAASDTAPAAQAASAPAEKVASEAKGQDGENKVDKAAKPAEHSASEPAKPAEAAKSAKPAEPKANEAAKPAKPAGNKASEPGKAKGGAA